MFLELFYNWMTHFWADERKKKVTGETVSMDLPRVKYAWPTFCGKMTRSVGKGGTVGVIYLEFSNTSDVVSCNILVSKLEVGH